jgi:lipoprotein-releasing system permease protein
MVKLMRRDPRVKGVSPQLATQVFYNYGPVQLGGTLSGVDIMEEAKFYDLQNKLVSGRLEDLMSVQNGLLMGVGLAKKLNVRVGDNVLLATPEGNIQLMKVVGIFKFGIGQLDDTKSYADLPTVQNLLKKPSSYITEIHLKLFDLNQAKEMSKMYQRQFGYKAEDWETANASILMSFVIRNILTYVVVITMLVVAGFGIYNIMNMTVIDKMKDIAILKATGFNGRDIVRIFITQSVIIGVAGGLAGLMLGFTFSYLLSRTPFNAGSFLSVDTFPVSFNPKFYVFGMVFGVLTTFLAGYLPARKASKVDPVAILRG